MIWSASAIWVADETESRDPPRAGGSPLMVGAVVGGAVGSSQTRPDPVIRARVTFLSVQEGTMGQKVDVFVEVLHLSRAERVAREQGYDPHRWHLYGVAEIHG
jgi:hypothetical protein